MACNSRRSAKQLEDAEKASHFVVQWTEGDDQGMLSRVPGSSIVSKPPLNVGCTILLKYAGKKGAIEKSKAQIMSKGSKAAMETAIARMTKLAHPVGEPAQPDCVPRETSRSCDDHGLTNSSQPTRSQPKRKQCDGNSQRAGKQKRKKPSMISDSDDDFDNAFDSLKHHTSSTTFDICEQPLSTDNQFLNAYKGLTLEQSLPEHQTLTSTPVNCVDTSKGITGSVLHELQAIKEKMKCLDDIKENIKQLDKKVETLFSQKVQSAEVGSDSNLQPESLWMQSPEVYSAVTLIELPCTAKSPQKYARKVLTHLFTKKEMASGLFSKIGPSSRPELSPTRRDTLMRCLKKKYTAPCLSKAMPQIRESLNQKCRDLRKQFDKESSVNQSFALRSKTFQEFEDEYQ